MCKIKLRRVGLPETVVSPTASSHSGVDVALEFVLTPAMPTQVTGEEEVLWLEQWSKQRPVQRQ